MKNLKTSIEHRWVAGCSGNRLRIVPEYRAAAVQPYLQRIESLRRRGCENDRVASAKATAWLQLAHVYLSLDEPSDALQAYIEAADSCFDGAMYDHEVVHLPHSILLRRFVEIIEEAERQFAGSPRLLRILREDSRLKACRADLYRWKDFCRWGRR